MKKPVISSKLFLNCEDIQEEQQRNLCVYFITISKSKAWCQQSVSTILLSLRNTKSLFLWRNQRISESFLFARLCETEPQVLPAFFPLYYFCYFFLSSCQALWYYLKHQKVKPLLYSYVKDIVFLRGFASNATKMASLKTIWFL